MNTRRLVLLDSIAHIGPECADGVVVSGSHGGSSAAGFVLREPRPPRAVFFNDAGGGKDDAGIVALALLDARGVACATYSHRSARIGEAADGLASGVLSHVNAAARAAGLRPGASVAESVAALGARAPE